MYDFLKKYTSLLGEDKTEERVKNIEFLSGLNFELGIKILQQIEILSYDALVSDNAQMQGMLYEAQQHYNSYSQNREQHILVDAQGKSGAAIRYMLALQLSPDITLPARGLTPFFIDTLCYALPLWYDTSMTLFGPSHYQNDNDEYRMLLQATDVLDGMIGTLKSYVNDAHKLGHGSHMLPNNNIIGFWKHYIIDFLPVPDPNHPNVKKAGEWIWRWGEEPDEPSYEDALIEAQKHRNLGIAQELAALAVPSFEATRDWFRNMANLVTVIPKMIELLQHRPILTSPLDSATFSQVLASLPEVVHAPRLRAGPLN